jgi:hypothetical protein
LPLHPPTEHQTAILMVSPSPCCCVPAVNEAGQLLISSDSLRLLPAQLPYELLGPLVLAAVDGIIANNQQQLQQTNQQQVAASVQRKLALQESISHAPPDKPQDQQQQGLQLVGIDLQQPVAAPLTTCMAAYSCLQQLSLQELNIDVCAAKALGSILHSGSSSFSSNGCSTGAAGCSLRGLTLDGVFMCDMAWQALCEGLAAGCELQTIRWACRGDTCCRYSMNSSMQLTHHCSRLMWRIICTWCTCGGDQRVVVVVCCCHTGCSGACSHQVSLHLQQGLRVAASSSGSWMYRKTVWAMQMVAAAVRLLTQPGVA